MEEVVSTSLTDCYDGFIWKSQSPDGRFLLAEVSHVECSKGLGLVARVRLARQSQEIGKKHFPPDISVTHFCEFKPQINEFLRNTDP